MQSQIKRNSGECEAGEPHSQPTLAFIGESYIREADSVPPAVKLLI